MKLLDAAITAMHVTRTSERSAHGNQLLWTHNRNSDVHEARVRRSSVIVFACSREDYHDHTWRRRTISHKENVRL